MMTAYNDSMFVPPWPEWSNDFINTEKWDQFNNQNVFKHPGGHECLPKEIIQHVKEWKRPSEMFGIDGISVQSKDDKDELQNLLTINEPLMHVEVYRRILYHVALYANRFKNRWPQPWHPSNLIFSRCKIEEAWNKKSKPEYNPFGKYWLKLFFMGKFRMICVSDHLPVSNDNRILLPLCENNKVLWLPLLVKGLLRIYTLIDEFNQFNTITCLTGWSCIQTNYQQFSKEDVWSSILSHSSNAFLDTNTKSKNKKLTKHTTECFPIKTDEGVQCHGDTIISRYEANPPKSIVIVVTLSPTINKQNKSNLLSRYPQPIILNNVKMAKNKSLPTWKQYRWTKWATENNIIKQHEVADFTRLVNIYAPCTVTLKQTCPLMKILNEYSLKSSENELQYELDFSYLEPFATHVEFYVKSSQTFPFVKSIYFRNKENQTDDVSLSKNSTLAKDNNCCVYLPAIDFESPYCESMLFTLSVCKNYIIRNGDIVPDEFSNQKMTDYPFINVERFYWYEMKLLTPLISIRTRGVSNDVMKFEPGIIVLKMWGELPDKYSLTVESTTDFSVHQTVETIYEKLTDQPKSLSSFIISIKHTFLQLCATEPNTSDHGQMLQKFYHSFMPPCVSQENELKKIERYSIISNYVQTAIVEWIESKFSGDLHAMVEAYIELQEIFQNKSLGKKQISNLNKKLKSQHLEETPTVKKKILEKFVSTKKSLAKWKSQSNKPFSSTTPSKPFKPSTSKTIHSNMLDILSNMLNSDKINFDEYYLKKDFLSTGVNIVYEENSEKQINPLLLFRLDLNTHSKHELAPSIIYFSNENNNDHIINLTLIDNDSQLEVRPKNIDMNMFMVNRTTKGYTLLGLFSNKKTDTDTKHSNYKLVFFGRPYQILHSCGTQKDNFYKFGTTVCDNLSQSNFMTKHVKNKFYKPNTSHLLARVLLKVDNAALYTIYCHIENLESLEVEIRVVDENDGLIVFASSRARGKTALIPVVFLDPNFDKSQTYSSTDDTEKTINAIFVIEVILIKNIEIDYINTQDQSSDYDWTIACTYDRKITEISLETDTSMNNFQFFNPIPHQMIIKERKIAARTTRDKLFGSQNLIIADNINKNNIPELNLNHHQMLESLMIRQDDELKQKLMNNNNLESLTSQLEKENNLKSTIIELFDEKIFTEYVIKKNLDLMTETHQILKEDSYKQVLQLHKIQVKSTMSMAVKQSTMVKRKTSQL